MTTKDTKSQSPASIIPLRSADIIDGEAADWLTKLDGDKLSPDDRRALKAWLAEAPEHGKALNELADMWSDMDSLLNAVPESQASEVKISLSEMFSLWFQRPSMKLVFSLCFIFSIGLFVWQDGRYLGSDTTFLVTELGKQRLETFSDGSSAHLNTNSIVETEFTDSVRVVRLLRGEALFDVAHDPDRPFIVYAGDRAVRAIGTTFVVRLDSENILVTVTDGQVQLSKREKSSGSVVPVKPQEVILVSKGEHIKVNDEQSFAKPVAVQYAEMNRRLSWREGQLVFENERLDQVIKEISRYMANTIIIDDPALREIRVSGRFVIGDTDALLEAIEVSFNVKVNHAGEKLIHLTREEK